MTEPYVHQPYPSVRYKLNMGTIETRTVKNEDEDRQAMRDGFAVDASGVVSFIEATDAPAPVKPSVAARKVTPQSKKKK